jgi:hypothetical protein
MTGEAYDARDHAVKNEREADRRHAVLLAIRLGPWAAVRAGKSKIPLEVRHCSHCERYGGEHLWHHRSCLVFPLGNPRLG